MIYVLSQIFVILAFVLSLIAYHKNKKEEILKITVISNMLNLVHYLLLKGYSGCLTKLLGIIRDLFVIKKGNNKLLSSKVILIIFILIYLVAGIILYSNIFSILPIIAAVIYLIGIWNGNELNVKKVAFICYSLWIIYNIFIFSILGIFTNSVSFVSAFIAYYKEKKNNN